MKWLNYEEMKVLLVVFVAAIVLSSGSARADFTFGEPTPLGPTVNTGNAWTPSISANGLELYFGSDRTGGCGGDDIWVSTRSTQNVPWNTPVNLGPPVNVLIDDWDPCISSDGLELYFVARRSGGYGKDDIWVAQRETIDDNWGQHVNLGPNVNSSQREWSPSISADGLELYFISYNRLGRDQFDIYVAKRTTKDDIWQEPVRLNENINGLSTKEFYPNISADGLVLFFSTTRSGGYGGRDLWMSRRDTTSDPWQQAVNLGPEINSTSGEYSSTVSSDGSMLYFESDRSGGSGEQNIWQAPIIPIVDFNGDGNIDNDDLLIMIGNWKSSETLCDIGPMPWGDGVVDIEDLKVFMEYWEQENMPQDTEATE
jgi:Tol biopolymer transport system component